MKYPWKFLGLYEVLGLYVRGLTQEDINQMIQEWTEENSLAPEA